MTPQDELLAIADRLKDRAMTHPRGGFTPVGMATASLCSELDSAVDEIRAHVAALDEQARDAQRYRQIRSDVLRENFPGSTEAEFDLHVDEAIDAMRAGDKQ